VESATKPNPTSLVIFGGGGDLAWRKLVPALYDLYLDDWLPDKFTVLGLDLKKFSAQKFRDHLREGVDKFSRHGKTKAAEWKKFASKINYADADFTDSKIYEEIETQLEKTEKSWGHEHAGRMFYLSVPPSLIEPICQNIGEAGLAGRRYHSRIVVEKPFGHNYESAHELNKILREIFHEDQIYRIDHYLGKETVQNILAFRFANALFEPLWNRRYIDHIQITVSETVGIEHRGSYYDRAGALRDMIQNHLLQLLCLVAMEPPVAFEADEVRDRKVDVLRAIRQYSTSEVHEIAVRGQYSDGWLEGTHVTAYPDEDGVAENSQTETFAAMKFFVDNWRWQDVPFYVRTGKRMPEKMSVITIQFRPVPHQSFPVQAHQDWQANRLILSIQPQKGIRLRFQAKRPGLRMILSPVDMLFSYSESYEGEPPEAYETLLLDIMLGDATLFMRADQIEAAWKLLDPILKVWGETLPPDFPNYAAGTWGPEESETLIAQDGRTWITLPLVKGEVGLGQPRAKKKGQ